MTYIAYTRIDPFFVKVFQIKRISQGQAIFKHYVFKYYTRFVRNLFTIQQNLPHMRGCSGMIRQRPLTLTKRENMKQRGSTYTMQQPE